MLARLTSVDPDLRADILQFLILETSLLDSRNFQQWLNLVAEDFVYQMPNPVTLDDPTRSPWAEGSYILNETRQSLIDLWFSRYEPESFEFAWGERPLQRVRRFISNTQIVADEESDAFVATSNVLLSFARQSDPVMLVPAGRVDTIRRTGDSFKLAKRVVQLDQTVLTTSHIRLIF